MCLCYPRASFLSKESYPISVEGCLCAEEHIIYTQLFQMVVLIPEVGSNLTTVCLDKMWLLSVCLQSRDKKV